MGRKSNDDEVDEIDEGEVEVDDTDEVVETKVKKASTKSAKSAKASTKTKTEKPKATKTTKSKTEKATKASKTEKATKASAKTEKATKASTKTKKSKKTDSEDADSETEDAAEKSKITATERLVLIVKTLQEDFDLDVTDIQASLKKISDQLPRTFPSIYGGKHKEEKPEGFPKKGSNAYIHFSNAVRPTVKKENEGASSGEIAKIISGMWGEIDEDDKKTYEELAEKDKLRYTKELEIYAQEHPEYEIVSKVKKSKKAPSAYNIFCSENRAKVKKDYPDADSKEIIKHLAERWTETKTDKKKLDKYTRMAQEKAAEFGSVVADDAEGDDADADDEVETAKPAKKSKATKTTKTKSAEAEVEETPQPKKRGAKTPSAPVKAAKKSAKKRERSIPTPEFDEEAAEEVDEDYLVN